MNVAGFDEYLERLLVELASRQSTQVKEHTLREVHEARFSDCPPTWLEMAPRSMAERGWGIDGATQGRQGNFWIEGKGLAQAQHLREKYRTKGLKDFFAAFTRSDWISIGAFIVSLFALAKGL